MLVFVVYVGLFVASSPLARCQDNPSADDFVRRTLASGRRLERRLICGFCLTRVSV